MTTSIPSSRVGKSSFQHFLVNNALVLVLYAFLLVAMVALSFYSTTFRSPANLWTLAKQTVIPGIIGIAQTLIILSGGIDLSVASLVTFISLVCAGLADSNDGRFVWVALLMLGVGLLVGLFNGLVVTYGRVPAFIATLGTSLLLQGAGLAYTTVPKGGISTNIANLLYYNQLGPVPHPVILLAIVFGAAWFILSKTEFGRAILRRRRQRRGSPPRRHARQPYPPGRVLPG